MTVQIAANATTAKLMNATREVKLLVQQILSYTVDGAEHSGAFKSGNWDGKASFFTWDSSTFPRGFLSLVAAGLIKNGVKVRVARQPLPAPLGPEKPKVDDFPEDPRYDYQPEVVEKLLKHGQIIAQVATGGGKCLGRDTPVLMYDGTIKKVQDVVAGDLLMGPDSTPRTVLSTCAGVGPLYRVTPTKGDAYVVNDAHILSLKKTCRGYRGKNRDGEKYPKGEVVNINVEDYLRQTKTFRHTHKGWRTGVDFPKSAALPVDPYLLGVILGDGTINGTISVTTADQEIRSMLEEQAALWGLTCNAIPKAGNAASAVYLTSGRTGGKSNPLMLALRDLGLKSIEQKAVKKFIPQVYKTASRADRLALLAGILDTDGHFDGKSFYLTLKDERLFDDTLFLVRSLGFAAYKSKRKKTCTNNGVVGDYFCMTINGAIDSIPVRLPRRKAAPRLQKKDPLVTGVSVEPIGEGEYYGFELDGDHLFMLGDFTVTHNTRIAKLCFARIARPTLFLTTRGILMHQMAASFRELGRTVGVLGDGEFSPKQGVNVGMVQTIISKLKGPDEDDDAETAARKSAEKARMIKILEFFEFVILEEAHEVSGDSFFEILKYCKNAHYRLALTATPFMKESQEANMRLQACSGPVAIRISEKMLIERGILAKPYFKYIKLKEKPEKLYRSTPWQRAVEVGIVQNSLRNKHIVVEAIRAQRYGLTTMILVQRQDHGEIINQMLTKAGVRSRYIFGKHEQTERQAALQALKRGEIDVLIGSTILDVGVDVPAVGMVILAGGGKAEVALRQRIGRGLREKKNGLPNVCFIVDFTDDFNNHLKDHAKQRMHIVKTTEGFAENIVTDFPFAEVGLRKLAIAA